MWIITTFKLENRRFVWYFFAIKFKLAENKLMINCYTKTIMIV